MCHVRSRSRHVRSDCGGGLRLPRWLEWVETKNIFRVSRSGMTVGQALNGLGRDWRDLMMPSSALQPTRLIAGEDLPRGTSVLFPVAEVHKIALDQSKFRPILSTDQLPPPLEVFLRRGELHVPGTPTASWVSEIPFAEDVHSEAARLSIMGEDGLASRLSLLLTLVKTVKKGELLTLWFSSEIASELGMPFLTFSHIRDGCYTCPNCAKKFDSPNPLKLHLATGCDILSSNFLWERLWGSVSSIFAPWETPRLVPRRRDTLRDGKADYTRTRHQVPRASRAFVSDTFVPYSCPKSVFAHDPEDRALSPDSTSRDQKEKLIKKQNLTPVHSKTLKSLDSLSHNLRTTLTPHSLSAFKPVVGNSQPAFEAGEKSEVSSLSSELREKNHMGGQSSSTNLLPTFSSRTSLPLIASFPKNPLLAGVPNPHHMWEWSNSSLSSSHTSFHPLLPLAPPATSHPSLPSTSSVDPNADVEAFVSSLGRGKGNHLCLYCGKVYSRKYGLKIHIRTHTGYKPLKCRVCLRPFGDPSNLNKHIRLHAQGETPYRCDLCGKVLVRKRDLDRHLRSRHPKALLPKLQPEQKTRECPENGVLAVAESSGGQHCFILTQDSCSRETAGGSEVDGAELEGRVEEMEEKDEGRNKDRRKNSSEKC